MGRLSTEQLEAIRNRVDKASAGDWYLEISTFENATEKITKIAVQPDVAMRVRTEADAEFIANARTDITKLLAEVERLREALQFYANDSNNEYDLKNAPHWTELEESAVMIDGGRRAEEALGGD